MCILAFAKNVVPGYPLILIGNRDEFYQRPTKEAAWWENGVLAGQDLEAKGTWLGLHRKGRFATLTNFRDINGIKTAAKSRGALPVDFLLGSESATSYTRKVAAHADEYNGFNLLTWENGEMIHFSNYERSINKVNDGIHVLSNALLDSKWYKTEQLKTSFSHLLDHGSVDADSFFELLADESKSPDEMLPSTGLSYEMEKQLSSICIRTPDYGTCCSTIVMINDQNEVTFVERLYPVGNRTAKTNQFQFKFGR
jgi:uncharacterized protein with NRDE domain